MSQSDTNLNLRATQSMQALVTRDEDKPKWFFIRRVPLRHMQREWERPADEGQYAQQLLAEGFITESLLDMPMSDELKADIRELDQYLLPHFWRANQRARFFQNRYYQYQWAFILSAFLTTALAAVNVFVYAQGWQNGTDTGTFLGRVRWTEILGLLTAIVSGIAAAVSFLDANQIPQKRWYKARAQAEAMRSLYFIFLARQKPFDQPTARERVQRMRQKVIEILRETRVAEQPAQPAAGEAPGTEPPPTPPPARAGRRRAGSR